MTQIPLGTGDFAFAYQPARQHFNASDWWDRDRALSEAREAAKRGVAKLREFRDVKRLPPGSAKLQEQIVDALLVHWERIKALAKHKHAGVYNTWDTELRARQLHSVTYAIQRVWNHELSKTYSDSEFGDLDLLRDDDVVPKLKRVNSYGRVKKVDAVLRTTYLLRVVGPRLIAVDGHFVLDADPVRDFTMPFGVRAAWRVQYARPVSHKHFQTTPGIVIEPEDRPRYLATPEALAYGALMEGTSAYNKARRRGMKK